MMLRQLSRRLSMMRDSEKRLNWELLTQSIGLESLLRSHTTSTLGSASLMTSQRLKGNHF
jgi:hypothetical protein